MYLVLLGSLISIASFSDSWYVRNRTRSKGPLHSAKGAFLVWLFGIAWRIYGATTSWVPTSLMQFMQRIEESKLKKTRQRARRELDKILVRILIGVVPAKDGGIPAVVCGRRT
jgi:hypothetical protein